MPHDNGIDRRKFLKGAGLTALAGATGSSTAVIADDDTGDGLFHHDPFDFDEVYHRSGTNCSRWDTPASKYPNGEFKYGMGVATTDFQVAPCITEALAERCKHQALSLIHI